MPTNPTVECAKAHAAAPPASPAPASATNGAQPVRKGLVYALFDQRAVARLERLGAEITTLRERLRAQHDVTTPAERVERCRTIAQHECLAMAIVVSQLRHRFNLQGSGMAFLRNFKPHIVSDCLELACGELVRMADPEVWRTA